MLKPMMMLCLLLMAVPATAQSTNDPRVVLFNPPPPACTRCEEDVPPLPAFDLGVHGFHFLPGDLRVIDGRWVLLTYETTQRAAVRLDLASCVAQVHLGFTAGLPAPLTWSSVQWATDVDSVWWHAGAMWAWRWDARQTVTLDLHALTFDDPRLGPKTPLCRWR